MKVTRVETKPSVDAPVKRLMAVFPAGFDSSRSGSVDIGSHYSYLPSQLYDLLLRDYIPERHVEKVVVTTAWYGKQNNSPKHEFILVEVEDKATPGLVNYIVLDRNDAAPVRSFYGFTALSRKGRPSDNFRVAIDGDHSKLLDACDLSNHRLLERLQFPSEQPLHLYELVALARRVSSKHPTYHPVFSNCYLFSGLIWECLRVMRPGATYFEEGLASTRGTFGQFLYRPEAAEVNDIHIEVLEEIIQVNEALLENMSEKLRSSERRGIFPRANGGPGNQFHIRGIFPI